MYAEFKHTLRRLRGQIIGWGIGLALYSLMMISIYGDIAQIDMDAMLEYYPEEMLAFFGDAFTAFNTPAGYMETYFFNYMPVIIGIFVVGACARLLVGDEEKGILDLVMAYPVSRTRLFLGRLLGFVVSLLVILLVAWLCWVVPSGGSGMELSWNEFLRPFVPLLAQLLLFGFLALLLSMLLPAARMAGWITGALLVANYLTVGLANINDSLESIVEFTPLNYYQGGQAINGLNWDWVVAIIGVALVFAGLAWWRFLRRDVRVGGEGGWRLPKLRAAR
ncbi:MAG: ABC transporter permease subunit [Anaerolineales bacterium]|jgi:ABC-2 type transport system permease protein